MRLDQMRILRAPDSWEISVANPSLDAVWSLGSEVGD